MIQKEVRTIEMCEMLVQVQTHLLLRAIYDHTYKLLGLASLCPLPPRLGCDGCNQLETGFVSTDVLYGSSQLWPHSVAVTEWQSLWRVETQRLHDKEKVFERESGIYRLIDCYCTCSAHWIHAFQTLWKLCVVLLFSWNIQNCPNILVLYLAVDGGWWWWW